MLASAWLLLSGLFYSLQLRVADGWGVSVYAPRPYRENLSECGAELKINGPGRQRLLAGDCLWVGDSDFWINGEARGGF